MSRSSKGFADFFPTAPSVLQQKRSRTAQHRKRQKSPSNESSNLPPTSFGGADIATDDGESGTTPLANGTDVDEIPGESTQMNQEESDLAQGDLLNGVGSASSSSTTSSVFSTSHRALGPTRGQLASTLTPLTNTDSSPPGVEKSPAHVKYDSRAGTSDESTMPPSQIYNMTQSSSTLNPVDIPRSQRTHARPGKGEVKGTRVVYDPDLDKTLSSKERKGRKVQYEDFGEDVCEVLHGLLSVLRGLRSMC